MFVDPVSPPLDTNHKGAIAEAAIELAAVRLRIPVLRPTQDGLRYDLALDVGEKLLRVQCKWAPRIGDIVRISTRTSRLTNAGHIRTTYTRDEIDAVAAYCADLDECYLLPVADVEGQSMVHLRLHPARNNQTTGVKMAVDYRFGAIAQLGERVAGSDEVVGSSPTSSTSEQAVRQGGLFSFQDTS